MLLKYLKINFSKKVIYLVFIIIYCLLVIYYFYKFHSTPSNPLARYPQTFIINKGASANKISQKLYHQKLIQSPFWFKAFLRLKGKAHQLKAEHYFLEKPHSITQMAEKFFQGDAKTIKIRILEGYSSWEIFSQLKKEMQLDSLILEKLLVDTKFIKKLGLTEKSLEGFLYPDTYFFSATATPKEILTTMVNRWSQVFYSLPYQNSKIFKSYSLKEIMVIASLIEKETSISHERAHISGVFWNRIKNNWQLGSDPTIRYFLKERHKPLRVSQLKENHAYNTRIRKGFTPTPITNPGKKSILASLYPKETQDFFFVSKRDGSQEHYFSKTLEKHNYYRKVSRLNEKKQLTIQK